MSNFHPLEVMDRGTNVRPMLVRRRRRRANIGLTLPQLQLDENVYDLIKRFEC